MNVPLPPEQKGKRLTTGRSFLAFLMSLGMFLVLAMSSAVGLASAKKFDAALYGLLAVAQLVNVPGLWKRYRSVKQGVVIYVSSQPSTPLPKPVAVGVVFVLTVLIAIASAGALFIVHKSFNTLIGWMVAGPAFLSLWLLTAYFWYRALSGGRRPVLVKVLEQADGVWPPAPLVSAATDDKD